MMNRSRLIRRCCCSTTVLRRTVESHPEVGRIYTDTSKLITKRNFGRSKFSIQPPSFSNAAPVTCVLATKRCFATSTSCLHQPNSKGMRNSATMFTGQRRRVASPDIRSASSAGPGFTRRTSCTTIVDITTKGATSATDVRAQKFSTILTMTP